jgi:hypothetical protein
MPPGGSSPYIKRDVEGHRAQYSGSAPGIATGTFIGYGTSQQAVAAQAISGTGGVPALGFAFMGQDWGTFTTKTAEHFDICDAPMGVGQVNSGTYAVGAQLWLSGSGLTNFSTTPPDAHGAIVQTLGRFVDDPNSGITGQSRRFRIAIGPAFTQSGSGGGAILRPFVTAGALS